MDRIIKKYSDEFENIKVENPPPYNFDVLFDTCINCISMTYEGEKSEMCNKMINKLINIIKELRSGNVNDEWYNKEIDHVTAINKILDVVDEIFMYKQEQQLIIEKFDELIDETIKTITFLLDNIKLNDKDKKFSKQIIKIYERYKRDNLLLDDEGNPIKANSPDKSEGIPVVTLEKSIPKSKSPKSKNPFAKGNIVPSRDCVSELKKVQEELESCKSNQRRGGNKSKNKRKYKKNRKTKRIRSK